MKQIKLLFFLLLAILGACGNPPAEEQQAMEEKTEIPAVESPQPTILFFGNSLSAGYGLEPEQAFPARIQERLDSLGYGYQVVNAGVSGETSSGGLGRISWILNQPVDIFVLELGGNDGLRGIPPAETRQNLQAIIDSVQNRYPEAQIVLAGMEAPPNMGQSYTKAFRNTFAELAAANEVTFIPFLLEGVGGEPSLNQDDGIHPNVEGAKMVANHVWTYLEDLLKKEPGTGD